jgi:hypothetical protein
MPSYHLSIKTISRSAGRSATAAAAYRTASKIADQRTGELHDYTRKSGVDYIQLVLPENAPSWSVDREALWNAAEQTETRKNSTVAREFEVALPSELPDIERKRLALDFAREIVVRHGCAADVAIHAPGEGGDHRNHHAHILCSTRKLTQDGFGAKTRELDDRSSGEVVRWRERFAELQNQRFKENGIDAKVDHRSLEAQGIEREPTRHLGVAATGYERRTGQASRKRLDFEREIAERLGKAKELGDLEREAQALERSLIDLSGSLVTAKTERDKQQAFVRQNPWQAAKQIKDGYVEADRTAWKKAEAAKILKAAQEHQQQAQQQAQQLRDSEPKKPRLFGVGDWQVKHHTQHIQIRHLEDKAGYAERQAAAILSGERKPNPDISWGWENQAQLRLEREHPELARAAHAQYLEQQRQANATAKIEQALVAFKGHAAKRQMKAFGYGDDGKHWQALPEQLRTMLDEFNKLPKEAQPLVLDGLREPKYAETLIQQLGQAKEKAQEQGHDRGWSR